MHAVHFNDGTEHGKSRFALVTAQHDDTKLDLLYWNGDTFQEAKGVARREPSDYGPEGGGDTWHS